jgi:hypothetical protein
VHAPSHPRNDAADPGIEQGKRSGSANCQKRLAAIRSSSIMPSAT